MNIYFEHHLQQHIYFDIYQQEILQLNIENYLYPDTHQLVYI